MNASTAERAGPSHAGLFAVASEQHGYFLASQARAQGIHWDLLSHHTDTGRFLRVRRGLYRLRDYPSWPREELVMAWLAAGKDAAVVSHESALELLELSDVIPDATHLTVSRAQRYRTALSGVVLHTTTRPFEPDDVVVRDGIRVTSVTRTIVDAAASGTAPEQIEMAVLQALERALTTPQRLEESAEARGNRVARIIHHGLAGARP